MDKEKRINCLYYDEKLDCCKLLSDLFDVLPTLQPCVESPCEHYKFCNAEIKEMAKIISEPQYDEQSDVLHGYDEEYAMERSEALYAAGFRKRREGEWVLEHDTYGKMLCSNCKEEAPIKFAYNETHKGHLEYVKKPYCPECGVKMKGGTEL